MQVTTVPFCSTGTFSKLICDYLEANPALEGFYNRLPKLENFKAQIEEKQALYSNKTRQLLVKTIQAQYGSLTDTSVKNALETLKQANSFTITTGHQLNLATGPLYFLYKIASVCNLCQRLKTHYPEYNFVPVFWMASEDHDFQEINHFRYRKGGNANASIQKFEWPQPDAGPVGLRVVDDTAHWLTEFLNTLGASTQSKTLKDLLAKAYAKGNTLAEATRILAKNLFKGEGLIILDGNTSALKRCFVPYMQEEITTAFTYNTVNKSSEILKQRGYHAQVTAREINLFYITDTLRKRIVNTENNIYEVKDTAIKFTKAELLRAIAETPHLFSPNALLRPLFQEVVLPNLAYIGGGGELAYWLQLQSCFKQAKTPFPILVLRNSVLLIHKAEAKQIESLGVDPVDLFLSKHEFVNKYIRAKSEIPIDFSSQKAFLKTQFKDLYTLAKKTDASFIGAVAAQEIKQCNGLDALEKRLLKAQKRKLASYTERLTSLHSALFPEGKLQERYLNFSGFYEYTPNLITLLINTLDPLHKAFVIFEDKP